MRFARFLVLAVCASHPVSSCAADSHLVTGNGFGFAVVQPESGVVSKFYEHPYSFARPDSQNPLSEGVETANFIQSLSWRETNSKSPSSAGVSSEYQEDSHVIHVTRDDGEGLFFVPFGLRRDALVISWKPSSSEPRRGGWSVEWSRAVTSQREVRISGVRIASA